MQFMGFKPWITNPSQTEQFRVCQPISAAGQHGSGNKNGTPGEERKKAKEGYREEEGEERAPGG